MRSLRKLGLTCEGVEWYNHYTRRKHDLFQFADVISFGSSHVVLLVQTTTKTNLLARLKKVLANPIALEWCKCPHRLLRIDGWYKEKHRWTAEHVWVAEQGASRMVKNELKHYNWKT